MRKPCCEKKETTRGAWSKQEDEKLIDYINKHGQGCWNSLPKAAGLRRSGRSCRLRWINYLRPDLKRGSIGEDEEDLIIRLHKLLGNRWSLIAGRLPGRTDNEVKNYWNSHLKKKLMINAGGTGTVTPPTCFWVGGIRGTAGSARTSKVCHEPNKKFAKYLNYIDVVVQNVDEVSDHSMTTGGNANGNMNGISNCLPDLNLDLDQSKLAS